MVLVLSEHGRLKALPPSPSPAWTLLSLSLSLLCAFDQVVMKGWKDARCYAMSMRLLIRSVIAILYM